MIAASGAAGQEAPQSRDPSVPSAEVRWRRVFPGEERQLRLVRRWLESLLPDCPARDDVLCIATELGANAIRHTASGRGGRFVLEVILQEAAVRVAIEDSGAAGAPQVIDDPEGEQGRGLLVVEGLSARFGVLGDHRGRTVWAEVPWGLRMWAHPQPLRSRPTRQSAMASPAWQAGSPISRPGSAGPRWSGGGWLVAGWYLLRQRRNCPGSSAAWRVPRHGNLQQEGPPAAEIVARLAHGGGQQRLASLSDRLELLKVAWAAGARWARCDRPADARRSYRPHPSLVSGLGYRRIPVF